MIGYCRCHLFTVKRESGWRVRRRESKPVYLSNVWDSEPSIVNSQIKKEPPF